MIEIREIKVPVSKDNLKLEQQIKKKLHLKEVPSYRILKRSIDARKKPQIFYIYTVGVSLPNEKQILQNVNDNNIMLTDMPKYRYPVYGTEKIEHHPLIIGAGPAGLFCALILSKMGYVPVIVERGFSVEERVKEVNEFFEGKALNPECNVQFGEGGAGTFSDGKLNTQVKDKYGRIRFVLETFVRYGAPEDILYDYKPHIGTDKLIDVIKGIRKEIESYGGIFLFDTKAVDIQIKNNRITAVKLLHKDFETWVESNQVVFAIGHSARDTFAMLYKRHIPMHSKDFAIGVRIEHLAKWIQYAMYGEGEAANLLPAAPYKLAYQTTEGRGVYSFCMCPGGYVVNASSEKEHIAVNGMSYSGRDGINSNSAIVVSVKQSDFGSEHPLAGMEFQRQLEHRIYKEGNGKVVVQRLEDFCSHTPTTTIGEIVPQIKGGYQLGNVADCLPAFITEAIVEAMEDFERKIPGFAHKDAILSGIESRTSSPLKIIRNKDFTTEIDGIYPCGEGAGYAGGIMSAAIDGMKVAEAFVKRYQPKKPSREKGIKNG